MLAKLLGLMHNTCMPACICGCQCFAYPFALEKVPLLPLCGARHELVHLCLYRLVSS